MTRASELKAHYANALTPCLTAEEFFQQHGGYIWKAEDLAKYRSYCTAKYASLRILNVAYNAFMAELDVADSLERSGFVDNARSRIEKAVAIYSVAEKQAKTIMADYERAGVGGNASPQASTGGGGVRTTPAAPNSRRPDPVNAAPRHKPDYSSDKRHSGGHDGRGSYNSRGDDGSDYSSDRHRSGGYDGRGSYNSDGDNGDFKAGWKD